MTATHATLATIMLAGVTSLLSSHARAQGIPNSSLQENISSWDTNCAASHSGAGSIAGGCYDTSGVPTNNVTASAYYVGGVGQAAVAENPYSSGFNEQEWSSATATAYFEVTGPSNSSIPLLFSASGATSATATVGSYGYASASVTNYGGATTLAGGAACSYIFYLCEGQASTGTLSPSFSIANESFAVTSNTLYEVIVHADGYGNAGGFTANADPSVSFDPTFNSAGYTLTFSPDASPAPVPLPAAAWLLLSGLGGLGVFARARSRGKAG